MKTFTNTNNSGFDLVHMLGTKDDYTITENNGDITYVSESLQRTYIVSGNEEINFKRPDSQGKLKFKWDDEFTPFLIKLSCKDILDSGQSVGDGIYTIKPTDTEFDVYCDMTTDGGGWTRAFKQELTNGNRIHTRRDLSSSVYSPLPSTTIIAEDANLNVEAEYLIVGRRNSNIAMKLKATYPADSFNSSAHNVCSSGIDLNTGTSRTWMTIFNQSSVSGTTCLGGGSSTNSFWVSSDGDDSHHLEYSFNTSDHFRRIGITDNNDVAPKELEVFYRI